MLRELEKLSYTKVLIIEDNMRFRIQIKEMLKEVILKPDIFLSKDLKEFFESLEFHKYKIILINCITFSDELEKIIGVIEKKFVKLKPIIIGYIPDSEKESGKLTDSIDSGIPNMIFTPFSVSDLSKILVKHNLLMSHVEKHKKARMLLKTLIISATKNIDKLSENIALAQRPNMSAKKNMKSLRARIETQAEVLDDDEFLDALLAQMENIEPVKYRGRKRPRKQKAKEIIRHPGYELKQLIESRNLSIDKLAKACKVDIKVIEGICKEELELTPDLAESLAKTVGQTQSYWMDLQRKFKETPSKRQ